MPLYEYACHKCGKTFQHLARSFSELPPKCPACGAKNPRKQLSTFHAGAGGGRSGSSCPTGTCSTGACSLG